jgi:hypothetical protein
MSQGRSTISELKRLFDGSIPAASIAEPLASFDEISPTEAIQEFMESSGFDLVGLRRAGLIAGYVTHDDLAACGDPTVCLVEFGPEECMPESGSLLDAMRAVRDHSRAFTTSLDQVTGIVTWADFSKAPIRMWLFNLVALLEMHMLHLIRQRYDGAEWRACLTGERVEAAEALLEKRRAHNQELDLTDCLQFGDKKKVLMKTDDAWRYFGTSKSAAQRFLEDAENLRNQLAHSQEILAGDWPAVIDLAQRMELALSRLEESAQ